MRADLYLVAIGQAQSRQKAKVLIESGSVVIDGKALKKAALEIDDTVVHRVEVQGDVMPYVSRGGLKLKGAIDAFALDVRGMRAVDFGASTGGFTDCLLQHGVREVYAVDAGRDQLHASLRADARVHCMEMCNARYLTLADLGGEAVDICVCDLSFISQTKIYDAVLSVLKEGGLFISLIKPQFEAGPRALNKHGIVRDEKLRAMAKESVILAARAKGLVCLAVVDSPITGGDGNKEYLALFRKETAGGEGEEG